MAIVVVAAAGAGAAFAALGIWGGDQDETKATMFESSDEEAEDNQS